MLERAVERIDLRLSGGGSATFKYKNASAPSGPSSVKITKVKAGLLKMVAKGVPFAVPNGAASIDVVVSLDGGTNTYCMTFSGTGDGSKFLAKDATAGSCAECGNDVQDDGEACDGTDDAACPGNCLPDCTCDTCGNDVLDGSEVCDGTADTACPNECLADCTCATPCPTAGSALACNQNVFSFECDACCDAVLGCNLACNAAAILTCADGAANDACSVAVTAAGCASECCPS